MLCEQREIADGSLDNPAVVFENIGISGREAELSQGARQWFASVRHQWRVETARDCDL
jgi:hypothetical protein